MLFQVSAAEWGDAGFMEGKEVFEMLSILRLEEVSFFVKEDGM